MWFPSICTPFRCLKTFFCWLAALTNPCFDCSNENKWQLSCYAQRLKPKSIHLSKLPYVFRLNSKPSLSSFLRLPVVFFSLTSASILTPCMTTTKGRAPALPSNLTLVCGCLPVSGGAASSEWVRASPTSSAQLSSVLLSSLGGPPAVSPFCDTSR